MHKTANVLDKMPKSPRKSAKAMLHWMCLAATRKEALGVYDDFLALYGAKCPRACACLEKDKEDRFPFCDFPARHWQHLRTTNPIESTFGTVRRRHRQTKGCGSREATPAMVHKLTLEAEPHGRRLKGHALIAKGIAGVKFEDGVDLVAA